MDQSRFRPITAPIGSVTNFKPLQVKKENKDSFSLHLQSAIQSNNQLVISKHAKERLSQRDIQISESNWSKIEQKVSEAKKLGINDSLVLLKNAALIVNAKNQTVITALGREEAESKIFTNINGTIVLE